MFTSSFRDAIMSNVQLRIIIWNPHCPLPLLTLVLNVQTHNSLCIEVEAGRFRRGVNSPPPHSELEDFL